MDCDPCQYIAASLFDQLQYDRPLVATVFGHDLETYTNEDCDPSNISAPISYVRRVAPVYKRLIEIESENTNYASLSTELKKEYDTLWASIINIVPDFVQRDLAEKYKVQDWNAISADSIAAAMSEHDEFIAARKYKIN